MKIIELWEKILNFFHLYTRRQMNQKIEDTIAYYDTEIIALREVADSTAENLRSIMETHGALVTKCDGLEEMLRDCSAECNTLRSERDFIKSLVHSKEAELVQLRYQVSRYKNAASENLDYVKDVQKQLSEVLHNSEAFGFPRSIAIPGSTSIRTQVITDSDQNDTIVVRGRTLTTDDLTARINQTPDMYGRLELLFNHMEQYGVLSRIAKELIRNSAVVFSLAYNDHCTTYEIYYEIDAKRHDIDSLVVIKDGEAG